MQAKALWKLGEYGLQYPFNITAYVPQITAFITDGNALLRERALNALGRIGRGDHSLTEPYLQQMRLLVWAVCVTFYYVQRY